MKITIWTMKSCCCWRETTKPKQQWPRDAQASKHGSTQRALEAQGRHNDWWPYHSSYDNTGSTDGSQDIAGQNYYRPIDPAAAAKFAKQYPKVNLFTIDEVFGGWAKAQKAHFADGGSFDKVYTKK